MSNKKMMTCDCGSVIQKKGLSTHLKSHKHRRFLGEDVPKARVKDETKIWVCMHKKVADCTEDQLKRRREYIARKMREHRARRKDKAINLSDVEDIEEDEVDITPIEITVE